MEAGLALFAPFQLYLEDFHLLSIVADPIRGLPHIQPFDYHRKWPAVQSQIIVEVLYPCYRAKFALQKLHMVDLLKAFGLPSILCKQRWVFLLEKKCTKNLLLPGAEQEAQLYLSSS